MYFKYQDKEHFLDVKKNTKFLEIINQLNKKNNMIPKNGKLLLQMENQQFKKLEKNCTPNDYQLKNGTCIIIQDNNLYL